MKIIFFALALTLVAPAMSSAASFAKFRRAHLERYLFLQHRSEFELAKFNRDLDAALLEQRKNPVKTFVPLSSPAYAKLRGLQSLIENEEQEIHRSVTAGEHLSDTRKWFATHGEADRFLLLGLVRELPASFTAKLKSSYGKLLKMRAMDREKLRRTHAAEFTEFARRAALVDDDEADSDFKEWAMPETAKAGQKIEPSTGPEGNIGGSEFPEGWVVWSFDDGPHPSYTPRLLTMLRGYRDRENQEADVSFFRVGEMALKYPKVIDQTRLAGYPLDSHSWTHADFTKLGQANDLKKLRHEVVEVTPVLEKLFGGNFRFYRCPGGACIAPKIPSVRKMIADQGLVHAYWSIDSLDWKLKDQPQATADNIVKQLKLARKGMILIHDIHDWSIDATGLALNWIKSVNDGPGPVKFRLLSLETAVDELNLDSVVPGPSPKK